MLVPIAREHLSRVVGALEIEKLAQTRMAPLHLVPGGPAVIGQVIAAAEISRAIDEPPEVARCLAESGWTVIDVQVEHDARPRLAGPRQHAFIVPLNEPDGAVDHVDVVLTRVIAN